MSQLNTIIIVGVLGVVAYLAWTQCWFNICSGQLDLSSEEFNAILPGLFQGGPDISQNDMNKVAKSISSGSLSAADYNKLPTIGNTKTSNYRSTSINTNPNARQNAATAINQQKSSKVLAPAVNKFNTNSGTRLTTFCDSPSSKNSPLCKNANYADEMETILSESIYGGRLSF